MLLYIAALVFPAQIFAREGSVLGVHILRPEEVAEVKPLVQVDGTDDETWHYVTIPYSLEDVEKTEDWQVFFTEAHNRKIIPIVRLVTEFKDGAWQIPNRRQLTRMISTLARLDWKTDDRYLIIFNEVNHAPEWGGTLDPVSYAQVFRFASQWARTESVGFKVMPAALDLAAPNGSSTMEAFTYWEAMLAYDPNLLSYIDIWNSHSYPNPGFSSSPTRIAQDSLRGFEFELAWLKQKTDREFKVMITETGWQANARTLPLLENYYTYALQHIWSNPQVIAVTPFLLNGAPGPFDGFSFLDAGKQPTQQYLALQRALANVSE